MPITKHYANYNRTQCAGFASVFLRNTFASNDVAASRPMVDVANVVAQVGFSKFYESENKAYTDAYRNRRTADAESAVLTYSRANATGVDSTKNATWYTFKGDMASRADQLEKQLASAHKVVDHLDLATSGRTGFASAKDHAEWYSQTAHFAGMRLVGGARADAQDRSVLGGSHYTNAKTNQEFHILSMQVKEKTQFSSVDDAYKHIFDPKNKGHYYISIADLFSGSRHSTAAVNGWGEDNKDKTFFFDPNTGLVGADTLDEMQDAFRDGFKDWPKNCDVTVYQVEPAPDTPLADAATPLAAASS